ncbi:ABC transporter ATP-binding protein [Anaerocolumna aminovalerica]|uniref:ATP-binding cassette, subfamily B n=1 Tax=Anaerocolumna aminovalerica TaxID=1527 RepID=A0A1I5GL14_9FIRM|nr:ABC transporter ATP-binding protein [Anaerocolumna aminovalerica]MBU5333309.1 ABC transporter ATP-binding protein/permease [Anaerocolumna aminovalerica]SFO36675.1 ATP-binding cassette, subfamily B [Anaerocolumna aminovalerica]
MLKLFKYLKKSIPFIILIFGLLVLQAFCDLSLPTYTSDIVDIGIQQGGVQEVVPVAIRESQMANIIKLLEAEEQETVLNAYTLLSKDNLTKEEFKDYQKKYPILDKENIYILKDNSKNNQEEYEKLEAIMKDALILASMLNSDSEETKEMRSQLLSQLPKEMADKNLLDIITILPKEQSNKIIGSIEEKIAAIPDAMIGQGVIAAVKNEYQAIGMNVNSIQRNYIMLTGAKMLGLALVATVASVSVGFLSARIGAGLGKDLRERVFTTVIQFSNLEFDQFSTASLITRSTNDIQQVQMIMVMLLRMVFYAPILAIGGVIKVLNTNTSMTWIIALGVCLLLGLVGTLFVLAMPKFKFMQKLVDKLNLVTREILTGLPVIRAFSKEKTEEKRFDKANRDLMRTNLFVNRVMAFMMPVMTIIMNGITILILWKGAESIDLGTMQVGDIMAFISYTMQIIMSFLMLSMLSIILPRASVSASRIMEVLNKKASIQDPETPAAFDTMKKGYVEFENVSFRYPKAEDDVLSNISFTAKPGETTAIIGSTGSGKSTLINLIPRFFDVTEGSVKVDGVDVRKITQHDLRDKLGYVPQKGVLFSGTIDSNIRYGNEKATQEEIEGAARIAQAYDFIEEKPDRYDSPIAQGGGNVSGGQKQRLSIARAIAKNPEIYIFDDSFSALDYKTDVALRKALKTEIAESTVIIVAQRISTILHADQILVLDEGKIVGKGTHKELLNSCEVYRQIALSQLSQEELE